MERVLINYSACHLLPEEGMTRILEYFQQGGRRLVKLMLKGQYHLQYGPNRKG
jgi:hypothetical protein